MIEPDNAQHSKMAAMATVGSMMAVSDKTVNVRGVRDGLCDCWAGMSGESHPITGALDSGEWFRIDFHG